jgi:ATP-dependent DNA ligase
VHEVKWDGFRAQAHLRDGKATTYSRSGLDRRRAEGEERRARRRGRRHAGRVRSE